MSEDEQPEVGEIKFANISSDNSNSKKILEHVLPQQFKYLVQSIALIKDSDVPGEQSFKTQIRINISNKEDVKGWIKDFQKKSTTRYNQTHEDRHVDGPNVMFSGSRKCQHNVKKWRKEDDENVENDNLKNSVCGSGKIKGCENKPGLHTECPSNFFCSCFPVNST